MDSSLTLIIVAAAWKKYFPNFFQVIHGRFQPDITRHYFNKFAYLRILGRSEYFQTSRI